ncbi:MAG TPA: HAD family hydrolase, partial [Vicinamibacterales bacterium]
MAMTLTRRRKTEDGRRKLGAVLIDLDDTLFDHRASARRALASAAACDPVLGAVAFETLEARHRHILEDLHKRVLDGHMTVDEARARRFRTLIEEQGGACDDPQLDRITAAYRAAYQSGWTCLAGARDLLAELKRREARIAIVTINIVS